MLFADNLPSSLQESRQCSFHSGKLIREPGGRQVQQVLLGVGFSLFYFFCRQRHVRTDTHMCVMGGGGCGFSHCIHLMVLTPNLPLTGFCVFMKIHLIEPMLHVLPLPPPSLLFPSVLQMAIMALLCCPHQ